MGFFDDIVHTVGASLAALFPHPPPVIHAAASTMLRAMVGDPQAHAKVTELARRSPPMAELLSHAHERFAQLPAFWQRAEAYARAADRGLLPHPRAPRPAPWLRSAPGGSDPLAYHRLALRPAPAAAEHQAALSAILAHMPFGMIRTARVGLPAAHASGRAAHGAHGGARTFRQPPLRGARHGQGWRRLNDGAPEHERSRWAGPWGWGADYLLDERDELGDLDTADEGEPEWGESRRSSWMAD